jgi:hypothetical protein
MALQGQDMDDRAGADYERSDIDAGVVGWIAAGLGFFVFAVPLMMPVVFPQSIHRADPQGRPALSADAPVLEVAPLQDLQRFKRGETRFLDAYGWTDRDRRIVRIPVSRAVESLIRKGLAGWPSP